MAKYNFELKKKIVLEHLSLGVGSKALAKKYNVKSARQIRQWIHNYNEFGEEGLKRSRQKNNYSFEFKLPAGPLRPALPRAHHQAGRARRLP